MKPDADAENRARKRQKNAFEQAKRQKGITIIPTGFFVEEATKKMRKSKVSKMSEQS